MEKLPSYEATTAASSSDPTVPIAPQRSIQDLRSLIVANGTLICQYQCVGSYSTSDHIEVIVAQTPPSSSVDKAMKTKYFNAQGGLARKAADPHTPSLPDEKIGSKHYAVLVRRKGSDKKINVIMQSKPQDTIEEALEYLLTMTMCSLHDKIIDKGTEDVEGCVVM